ncbi:hypothetical protein [Gellertiella hungarica]|uniref:Uncharacterized protein n=1 Tax=Gellertiella hungarica TaxID=1572859 RepID=A0A7W6J9J1_9HYPH|nr:hypothetical protein [Gellertiella hungarica]MBB4066363.1 hypothetical protein [Gellertiella hungarica]
MKAPKATLSRMMDDRSTRKGVAGPADDGMSERAAPHPADTHFPPRSPEGVFGMLKRSGPPLSLEEMDRAIAAELASRHAGR